MGSLVDAYSADDISREDVFKYLFHIRKLSTDYTQLQDWLNDIQIQKDYHGYTISGKTNTGDIDEYMERLLAEVDNLD